MQNIFLVNFGPLILIAAALVSIDCRQLMQNSWPLQPPEDESALLPVNSQSHRRTSNQDSSPLYYPCLSSDPFCRYNQVGASFLQPVYAIYELEQENGNNGGARSSAVGAGSAFDQYAPMQQTSPSSKHQVNLTIFLQCFKFQFRYIKWCSSR